METKKRKIVAVTVRSDQSQQTDILDIWTDHLDIFGL